MLALSLGVWLRSSNYGMVEASQLHARLAGVSGGFSIRGVLHDLLPDLPLFECCLIRNQHNIAGTTTAGNGKIFAVV